MEILLEVAGGNRAGQTIPITGSKFIIGRAEDCHLKPKSELISRYHCAIVTEDDFVAVRDLGSKNGVYLNGERISLENELNEGDKLCVGPLEFVVRISDGAKATVQKQPKIETVEQAVARTVEIEPEQPLEGETADVADWLAEDGDVDDSMETISVQPYQPDTDDDEIILAEKGAADKSAKKAPQAAASRDVAANLLKNFFKGR